MNSKGEVSNCQYTALQAGYRTTVASIMQIIQTSDENEPLTFEVGAGEVMGNKMFQVALQSTELATLRSQLVTGQQAFDAGVRGLHIGDKTYLEVIFPNLKGVSTPHLHPVPLRSSCAPVSLGVT